MCLKLHPETGYHDNEYLWMGEEAGLPVLAASCPMDNKTIRLVG